MRFLFVSVLILSLFGCTSYKRVQGITYSEQDKEQLEFTYAFTEAMKFKMLGNFTEAAPLFFRCLKLNPKSAVVHYQLANMFLGSGYNEKALYFAKKSVYFDESNEWYILQLAQIYQLLGNIDSTVYCYERVVRLKPRKFQYALTLAMLYVEDANYKKAVKFLSDTRVKFGSSPEIYVNLYKAYIGLGDHDNCVLVLNQAIADFPYDTRFYGLLGEHYKALGQDKLALSFFNRLLSIEPDNEKAKLSIVDFYREQQLQDSAFRLAFHLVSLNDFSLNAKLELVSSFVNDRKLLSAQSGLVGQLIDSLFSLSDDNLNARNIRANYFVKCKEYTQALADYKYMLSKDRKNQLTWEQLFFVLSVLNEYNVIIELSDEALDRFKENPLFYFYTGISYYQLKQYRDAISVLAGSLKYVNSNELLGRYYSVLAESYHVIGDNQNSDLFFEEALKIQPSDVYLLNNYSYYLSLRNDKLKRALVLTKRCNELEPGKSTFLDTYGWVLYRLSRLKESKSVLELALKYGGETNVTILEHYIEVLVSMRQREDALRFYELIRKLGKDSGRVRELLKISN